MSLKAGSSRRNISNRKPLFLVGYPHVPRISEGIHDPLYASALYLHDGTTGMIFVAVDILFVHHKTAAECRKKISRATGIPAKHVLISATHTHSGPVTSDMLSWRDDATVQAADPEYMQRFVNGIVQAAVEAVEQAVEAELAATTAYSEGVGCNRLSPDGPRDPEVGVLVARRRADARPLAIQTIYSMHPTVLHEDSRQVSSDFPHYTRVVLEQAYPGCVPLYHTGPCGNLSTRYHVKGQTFAEAERLGGRLGKQVLDAVQSLEARAFHSDITIASAISRVTLPPRSFCSVVEAEAELRDAVAEYERLKAEGAPHGPVRTAECTVFGAEERVTLAKAQENGETAAIQKAYNPVEVQAFRIGDAFLVGFPGECFVEYALELKRKSPRTFVISLANGELQGYIATPEATGYEARLSFFEPEAGDRMVNAALALIDTLV